MLQKFLLTILGIILILPSPSYAQRKGQTTEVRIDTESTNLFPRSWYSLAFLADPKESETKFTMRFQAHGVVAGCASMKKGRVPRDLKSIYKNVKNGAQVKYSVKKVSIAILDTELEIDEDTPRYGNHDCENKSNISYVDIPFDRDHLIKNQIKKLSLESIKYGDFGEHELDVNEDRIIFKVAPGRGNTWMTFWFFPSNSIVLEATGAKQGQDLTDMIREFGISHGLIPMEDVLEGYKLPHSAKNYVFFTDPSRRFIGQLNNEKQSTFVGKITPTRTIYGVDGPREIASPLDVQAAFPVQPKPE